MKKRITAMALAILMLISMIPLGTTTDVEATTTDSTSTDKTLTLDVQVVNSDNDAIFGMTGTYTVLDETDREVAGGYIEESGNNGNYSFEINLSKCQKNAGTTSEEFTVTYKFTKAGYQDVEKTFEINDFSNYISGDNVTGTCHLEKITMLKQYSVNVQAQLDASGTVSAEVGSFGFDSKNLASSKIDSYTYVENSGTKFYAKAVEGYEITSVIMRSESRNDITYSMHSTNPDYNIDNPMSVELPVADGTYQITVNYVTVVKVEVIYNNGFAKIYGSAKAIGGNVTVKDNKIIVAMPEDYYCFDCITTEENEDVFVNTDKSKSDTYEYTLKDNGTYYVTFTTIIYTYTFETKGANKSQSIYYYKNGQKTEITDAGVTLSKKERLGKVYFDSTDNTVYASSIKTDDMKSAQALGLDNYSYDFSTQSEDVALKNQTITVNYSSVTEGAASDVVINVYDKNGKWQRTITSNEDGKFDPTYTVPEKGKIVFSATSQNTKISSWLLGKYGDNYTVATSASGVYVGNLVVTTAKSKTNPIGLKFVKINSKFVEDDGLDKLSLAPQEKEKTNNVFYKTFNLTYVAQDKNVGIREISYWITDGKDEEGNTIYTDKDSNGNAYTDTNPHSLFVSENSCYGTTTIEKSGTITVNVGTGLNDDDQVEVHLRVVNNYGRVEDYTYYALVDTVTPEIAINYADDNPTGTVVIDDKQVAAYGKLRTATIILSLGKQYSFSDNGDDILKALNGGITYSYENEDGWNSRKLTENEIQSMLKRESCGTNTTTGKYEVKYTLTFSNDGVYNFDFAKYRSAAGNVADCTYTESQNPFMFSVCAQNPSADCVKVTINGDEINSNNIWSKFIGFFSKKVTVKAEKRRCQNENPYTFSYYKVDFDGKQKANGQINEADLIETLETAYRDGLFTESTDGLTVDKDDKFSVYIRVANAGNHAIYMNTNGVVLDSNPVDVTINSVTKTNKNGYYNKSVDYIELEVTATDESGTANSGLKEVSYKVWVGENNNDPDSVDYSEISGKSQGLYSVDADRKYEDTNDTDKKYEGNIQIATKDYNSNFVFVTVHAVDWSGNVTDKTINLKIDKTEPTVSVSYDNNNVQNGSYYNAERTATITITERNFNADDVKINITNEDGSIPKASDFRLSDFDAGGNGDGTTHIATITYSADGDYTFDISCQDMADNVCEDVSYIGTTPTAFTIDCTAPVASISYDNNNAANGTYYKAARTATITVTEHNFNEKKATAAITAKLAGADITVPTVSWTSNGDVHTGTVFFVNDGDYTIGFDCTDFAGNASNSIETQEFTIDQTPATVDITGAENGRSYTDTFAPSMSASDINFDSYDVTLTRSVYNVSGQDVTTLLGLNNVVKNDNGFSLAANNVPEGNDGIYTLTVTATDLAGNETKESRIVALNRDGSFYAMGDYLSKVSGGYFSSIDEDIVLSEYNASDLVSGSYKVEITRDGELLDADYDVTNATSDKVKDGLHGWYEYDYVISKDNFTTDGVYEISVTSKDGAGHSSDISFANEAIKIYLDSTKPTINPLAETESGEYSIVDKDGKVAFNAFDAMGLESVEILVDGEVVMTYDDCKDETNYDNKPFTIENYSDDMEVIVRATDHAGNIEEQGNLEEKETPLAANSKGASTGWFAAHRALVIVLGCLLALIIIAAAVILVQKNRKKANA